MTKVRVSQIPESSGEPIHFSNEYAMEEKPLGEMEFKAESEDKGEEKPQYIKTVIHIKDAGVVLSLHDINSIEKTFKIQTSDFYPDKVTQLYGISINRGMEPSMRFPKTNIELWFEKEEVRDQRYDRMMKVLKEAGFKFIEV